MKLIESVKSQMLYFSEFKFNFWPITNVGIEETRIVLVLSAVYIGTITLKQFNNPTRWTCVLTRHEHDDSSISDQLQVITSIWKDLRAPDSWFIPSKQENLIHQNGRMCNWGDLRSVK